MKIAEVTAPTTLLYHSAPTEYRDSVLRHGLLASKSSAYDPSDENLTGAIYFASKPVRQPGFDLWQVNVSGLNIEEDYDQPDETDPWFVIYGQDIPPDRLKLV